ALSGWRLGYAVAAEAPRRALGKIANHTVYNAPEILQRAAARVLADPASVSWQVEARRRYQAARDLGARHLTVPHHQPEAGTYFFVDLGAHVGSDGVWPLVERLLDAGVSIAPGEQFGRDFAAHARLCFAAVPEDRLVVGLGRMASLLGPRP